MACDALLDVDDLTADGIVEVIRLAGLAHPPKLFEGKGVCAVFERPSTRTRHSTEMAVFQLGGHVTTAFDFEVGIDTRESAEDIARTLAGYYSIIAARVRDHRTLLRMREALAGRDVPLINLLSDFSHPMQALADILTIVNRFGSLAGVPIAYVGDSNNVARSLVKAVALLGGAITVSSPDGFSFSDEERDGLRIHGGEVNFVEAPVEAVSGARVLYTDVWTSMGQEAEAVERRSALAPYQINADLLAAAEPDAVVLHCLPAHRGEEITSEVLESERSLVWAQAENRMHAMRGVLLYLAEAE